MHLNNGNSVSLCVAQAWSKRSWMVTWYVSARDGRLLEDGSYAAPTEMVDAAELEGFVAAKYAELIARHS